VLLVEDDAGWALPRATGSDPFVVTEAQHAARERIGLEIAVLRSVLVEYPETDEDSGDAFFFTENRSEEAPRLGEWRSEEALAASAMLDERDRAAIGQWFKERRNGRPPRLQPWQLEGWFAAADPWIRATLRGVTLVEQFYAWSGSSILRIDADGRRLYFKASPDFFPQEATVTAMLAERFPESSPGPSRSMRAVDG